MDPGILCWPRFLGPGGSYGPGWLRWASSGQSHPELGAAALVTLYMVLGSPFWYQVLIIAQVVLPRPSHIKQSVQDLHLESSLVLA